MKTIDELKDENKKILETNTSGMDKKELNALRRNISKNNKIISALQLGATKESLTKDFDNLTNKITLLEGRFQQWKDNTPQASWGQIPIKTFETQMGIPRLKQQLNFCKMILNS